MADEKVNLPSGMGGLVRYFDEAKSKIELSPYHVLAAIALIIVIEIFLHLL